MTCAGQFGPSSASGGVCYGLLVQGSEKDRGSIARTFQGGGRANVGRTYWKTMSGKGWSQDPALKLELVPAIMLDFNSSSQAAQPSIGCLDQHHLFRWHRFGIVPFGLLPPYRGEEKSITLVLVVTLQTTTLHWMQHSLANFLFSA